MVRWLTLTIGLFLFAAPAWAADKLVLQLRWDNQFQFAGYYAALWQGHYAEAGLDVEIRSAITPERKVLNSITEVSEGRADIGISAADILLARSQGAPLMVLASIFQRSPVGIISRRDAGVTSPADLSRLKVFYEPNGLAGVEMRAMLSAEGVDFDAMETVQASGGSGPYGFFARGEVDAYPGYVWTALWSAKEHGIDVSVLSPSTYGIDFYGDSLFTREDLARTKPDALKRFIAATRKGWIYALENPDEMSKTMTEDLPRTFPVEDLLGFNVFQSREVAKLTLYPLINLGHINPDRWRRMHETLKDFGMVSGEFDERALIFDPEKRKQERAAQLQRWLTVGGVLLLVFIVSVLIWNRLLRRQVQAATGKLQTAYGELEQRVRERTQELNATKERLASTFDAIDEGVWDWNIPTKGVIFSANWPRIFGHTMDEIEPSVQTWLDMLHPDDMPLVMARVEDHFQGRAPVYQSEHRMRHKDGRWLWVLDRGRVIERDGQGQPVRMVGAALDISKRKEAEENLRKLSRAVEQSPSSIFITDTDGTIEYINSKFTQMTGYPPDEAIGRNLRLLKSGDTPTDVIETLWETIKSGQEWRGEIKDRRRDGTLFWVYETIAPVKDERGEITHFVATQEDISERKGTSLEDGNQDDADA